MDSERCLKCEYAFRCPLPKALLLLLYKTNNTVFIKVRISYILGLIKNLP